MLVLIVVKYAGHVAAAPGESRWVCRRERQTGGQTDGHQTVTLRFSLFNVYNVFFILECFFNNIYMQSESLYMYVKMLVVKVK